MCIYENQAYVASGNQGDYVHFFLNILSFVASPVDNSRIYRRGEVVPIIGLLMGSALLTEEPTRSMLLVGKVRLSMLPAKGPLLATACRQSKAHY